MKKISLLLAALVLTAATCMADIKYVFLMIGDGMGVNQVFATERYLGSLEGGHGRSALTMTSFPNVGLSHTYSTSNGITDSAAGGTALSAGEKTSNGTIAMDSDRKTPLTTIAEMARDKGMAVGIVTSVSIDHATPAVFYSHVPDRNMYYEIGCQLSKSDFDFFGGAWFMSPKGKKGDQRDLLEIVEENGYSVVKGMNAYKGKESYEKVILTQTDEQTKANSGSLPYAIDRKEGDMTLGQLTSTAIDFLDHKGGDKGFFLMVEGGAIDWACHGNDGATALTEVKDFDGAIRMAYEFYLQHPRETLIVVSADHETGGLALGNSDYTTAFERLGAQKLSQSGLSYKILNALNDKKKKFTLADMKEILRTELGFYDTIKLSQKQEKALEEAYKKTMSGKGTKVDNEYFKDELIAATAIGIINRNSKVGWTTGAHSSAAVPVFAIGEGSELLRGVMQNNEIARRIARIADLK